MINVTHVDRFKVIKLIGRGGQGEVIHVRDTDHKDYALKWLLPYVVNQGSTDRFLREFHSICNLSHPNVIKVFEQGQFLNRPYFTMELVSGDNLESFLDREKNFEVYYDILVQISGALAYIHNHRLVHRDIKPSNVLIDSAGQAKLMDFGLVKKLDASVQLTQADKFFGTMSYASPEQLLGEKIDYRSDLYSLGILIYRMFSSRLPFHAESMVGIITKHLSEVPTPLAEIVPNCPVRLSDLCERLLMKSPLDRNLSAIEVGDIIRNMSPDRHHVIRRPVRVEDQAGPRLQLRFLGREAEMNRLTGSIGPGNQFVVRLICGENGIGKSRLLNEAVKASLIAGNSRKIMRCAGQFQNPGNFKNTFFKFIADEIVEHMNDLGDLAGILPEIAPLHPVFKQFESTSHPEDGSPSGNTLRYRIRYLSALVAQLSQIKPWLVVWEDIHLANAFELECLTDLMELSRHQVVACCIWASVRTDDFQSAHEFESFVADFNSTENSELIHLKPLANPDAEMIIASVINRARDATIVSQIAEFCRGNPSVILQTIQHWIDNGNLVDSNGRMRFAQGTDSRETLGTIQLQDIVGQQLKRLSEQALELLTWIAVLDQDAYLEVIRYALQYPEKELLKLLNDLLFHNLLLSQTDSNGERYIVNNPVVREAIVSRLDTEKLSQIHSDIVGIMELLGGHYSNPLRLARHQELAGDLSAACKNYFNASLEEYKNNQILASRDAMTRCYRVLSDLPSRDSRTARLLRARILILYSKILQKVGTMDEKKRLTRELEEILPYVHGINLKTDIYCFAITQFTYSYEFEEAKRWFREYEMLLQQESAELGFLYFQLQAMLFFYQRDYVQANRFWKKALIIQKTREEPVERIVSTMFLLAKTLTATERYKASFQLLLHAIKMLPKGKALREQALLLAEMGNVAFYQGNLKLGITYLDRALAINDTLGLEYSKACNLHDLGLCYFLLGDISEANRFCGESLKIFRILKTPRENVMGTQTAISFAFTSGDYAQALNEWEKTFSLLGEQFCIERNPYLAWLQNRTMAMTADKHSRRQFLFRLLAAIGRDRSHDWKESKYYLLLHQRLAENNLDAAERICVRLKSVPSAVLNFIPLPLQQFMIRILNHPEEDHTGIIDPGLMEDMARNPAMAEEQACLEKIMVIRVPVQDISGFIDSIERVPCLPGQLWLLEILAYCLRRAGDDVTADSVRKQERLLRDRMATNLPEMARKEFLSRKVIIRI